MVQGNLTAQADALVAELPEDATDCTHMNIGAIASMYGEIAESWQAACQILGTFSIVEGTLSEAPANVRVRLGEAGMLVADAERAGAIVANWCAEAGMTSAAGEAAGAA
jgi:hypothetical protein